MEQHAAVKRLVEEDGFLRNPIPLAPEKMAPLPEYFVHHSGIHGQSHVARVIVHTLALLRLLGLEERAAKYWAAAYIHDLGREHDGMCRRHGKYALEQLETLPHVRELLGQGGVTSSDWEGISVAVKNHCREEIPRTHPHWEITAVLKDADGLDRVRLGDLNPRFLRFPQSHALIPFAKALYRESQGKIPPGPGYFTALWPVARGLMKNTFVHAMDEGSTPQ